MEEESLISVPEEVRLDVAKLAPDAYRHLLQLEGIVGEHVEPTLLHLIKLRASQINGCAFCIAMHTAEALRDGEPPVRLTSLDAWHESPLYSSRERTVLTWVEEITNITTARASTVAYERLKKVFNDEEVAWLTLAATLINAWNRIAIASRARYVSSG